MALKTGYAAFKLNSHLIFKDNLKLAAAVRKTSAICAGSSSALAFALPRAVCAADILS